MHPLTTLLLLTTALTLTASTQPPNTTAAAASLSLSAAAATTYISPPSAASLAASTLPGGTANPALTLYLYADPDCLSYNSTYTSLIDALPLSYDKSSPQFPFLAFVMTRNLTGGELLSFYSTSNASADACGALAGNVTAGDGGAGWCLPATGGATCFNLTQS